MKNKYIVKIKKASTMQTMVREVYLTYQQAQAIRKKLNKVDNGYILTQMIEL